MQNATTHWHAEMTGIEMQLRQHTVHKQRTKHEYAVEITTAHWQTNTAKITTLLLQQTRRKQTVSHLRHENCSALLGQQTTNCNVFIAADRSQTNRAPSARFKIQQRIGKQVGQKLQPYYCSKQFTNKRSPKGAKLQQRIDKQTRQNLQRCYCSKPVESKQWTTCVIKTAAVHCWASRRRIAKPLSQQTVHKQTGHQVRYSKSNSALGNK